MSRSIICTVGTSLLTNRDDRPWSGWTPSNPLPNPQEVVDWMQRKRQEQQHDVISAEVNTLYRMDIDEYDRLYLLHSATPEGRYCAERLREFHRGSFRDVELREIGKLGYAAHDFERGLRSLVSIATTIVNEARRRGETAVFCATGGFKAEIAFLNVLGALLGVEVCYIHEKFREMVRFPRLPIEWNAQFILDHEDFFRWIDEEPRSQIEVEQRLHNLPAEYLMFIEYADDGNAYLSAAGDLVYQAAKERRGKEPVQWPPYVTTPPERKNGLAGVAHHRPAGWERVVDKLCRYGFVTMVRYDEQALAGERVRVLDGENGVIGFRYCRGDNKLPLRVETTARGVPQTQMVAERLRQDIR